MNKPFLDRWTALLSGSRVGGLLGCLFLLGASACGGQPLLTESQKQGRIEQMYAESRLSFPTVVDITAEELLQGLASGEGFILIDVREARERAVSTIPGAITLEQFESQRESLRESRIVTFCTIGHRSGLTAETLAQDGYTVDNLAGSLLAWTHVEGPLVDPDGRPTQRVHVYGKDWDLAASGYETVW